MIRAVPLVLLLLALLLAACGDDAPSSSGLNGELRYVKSGGFAGEHVEMVVQPDGSATVKSRRGGERELTLTEEELEAVAAEAEDLPEADAVSARPAPDAFVYTLSYDERTVKTDDPNLAKSGLSPLIGRLEQVLRG